MSSKLKVCHIVNWYPNSKNENEAIWTKRHIESLNAHCDNDVFHVQVVEGRYKFESRIKSSFEQSYILSFPTRIWFLKEILTTLLLCYVILFKLKRSKYDIFNFQITYPLLTYSKLICWLVKKPIVVTEHWSAYHLNFGVEKELKRIKRIFKNKKLKFICVSEALVEDIESFSEKKIDYELVPNVIDDKFKFKGNVKPENSFFLLSYWKEPKDPFMILEVFGRLKTEGHNFVVSIGGYGPMIEKMEETIRKLNLQNNVKLLGVLNDIEIIKQFNEDGLLEGLEFDLFKELLSEVSKEYKALDALYAGYLDRSVARIDPVERAIMRMGVYELQSKIEIPYKVVINESVELAKRFGAEESHKYVNGILDKAAKQLRSAEIS